MAKEKYGDLVFQLGDLAREHLPNSPKAPPEMQGVFDAEDDVLAKRDELAQVEQEMNDRDLEHQDAVTALNAEMDEQKAITIKWRSAVVGVENLSRDIKKRVRAAKAAFRTQRMSLKRADTAHKELEMREGHDVKKIAISKENLKKFRLRVMRMQRDVEDLEYEFKRILVPRPGQVGAQGILAHKRILECEDELEERQAEHDEAMKQLDETCAAIEVELKELEAALDDAVWVLGEAVYAERIAHTALNGLYPRLDVAK
jgi:predicted  nucleic acid-binding Zn-ribbon protein